MRPSKIHPMIDMATPCLETASILNGQGGLRVVPSP
jgi:hypothetical protein